MAIRIEPTTTADIAQINAANASKTVSLDPAFYTIVAVIIAAMVTMKTRRAP